MRRLLKYLKPFARRMSLGVTIKTLGTLMDLAIPYILAYMIDYVVKRKNGGEIVFWGVIMIVCSVVDVLFNIIANRMASRVAAECIRTIRHDLFERISFLSSEQTDKLTISSLESRLTSDTYNVHSLVGTMQRLGIRAPILLVGGIIVTFMLDPVLTLVMICSLPFIYMVVMTISRRGVPLYTEVQHRTDRFTKVLREDAEGIRVIKALSKTEYEKQRFDRENSDAIKVERRANEKMALINPLITIILNATLCAVIIVGANLVSGGRSETGTIIAFMSYFSIISNALISVTRMFVMYSKGAASMNRIDEVLSTEPGMLVEEYTEFYEKERGVRDDVCVEFRKVSFSYGDTEVLKDISFRLCRGQTLGIIGTTGSGKTTVVNLIMRFYDASEGDVLVDGVNVREYPTAKLRKKFGAVFQNDFLFADKIKENVRFGRDIGDEALLEAEKHAQAEPFISACDGGNDRQLTIKGANLSGGQRQRLLISRAFAANPEILILDDSSSALDYKTDALLRRAIAAHFSNTTSVIVAQRVSAIMHADIILVLDGGRVIGKGSHTELLESCPEYRDIADSQMGGAVIE